MTTNRYATYESWTGGEVYDSEDRKVGKVDHVVYDSLTERPEFLAVNTGLFGLKTTFVPITGSRWEGERLVVPWTKDHIKDAPNVEGDDWNLEAADERSLFEHYGLDHEAQPFGRDDRADLGYMVTPQDTTGPRLRRYRLGDRVR